MHRLPSTPSPELLAPAGNWDCVRAAIANGADAVYFGLPRFNARMRADNFTEAELPALVAFCHRHGLRAYATFNTLVFSNELAGAADLLRVLHRAGVDAVIVQDIGLARLASRVAPGLPLHASTQMTLTSPEGVELVRRELGLHRVVLAREVALQELERFPKGEPAGTVMESASAGGIEYEVFVHGALCIAYSGQCLTSESLGRRSANRGECAQACRLPYELLVDGERRDLGDRRYLLSPQDLAAVGEIPALIERGVASFKIEGRLKSPEYVAAVCKVYREAIDRAVAAKNGAQQSANFAPPPDRKAQFYPLEMTFSRGFFPGWLHGVNHQKLVAARFGKKRGAFVGRVSRTGRDRGGEYLEIARLETGIKPGDGVAIDIGGDPDAEQGGRVYEVRIFGKEGESAAAAGERVRLAFKHGQLDFHKIPPDCRLWKTDDPALDAALKKSYAGTLQPRHREPVSLCVSGRTGEPMRVEARRGADPAASLQPPNSETAWSVASTIPLQTARTAPLGDGKLREHLGRFGETPFALAALQNDLEGPVILPIAELNRLRRELVTQLESAFDGCANDRAKNPPPPVSIPQLLAELPRSTPYFKPIPEASVKNEPPQKTPAQLSVLCRTDEQLDAVLADTPATESPDGDRMIYLDFEDIRRYAQAVERVRIARPEAAIFLATPRIQKSGEVGFFKLIEAASPDGVLLRNLGGIDYFRESPLRKIGDFSLNVANPFSSAFFLEQGLERLTVSYDLNLPQVLALLGDVPPEWRGRFELTLHQHMPMFHMEHCAFAAFLSQGASHLDCGRPCERHRVHLCEALRGGAAHPLRADAGCRNTLFNAVAQTGALFYDELFNAGLRHFRIELLEESGDETGRILAAYCGLLSGQQTGAELRDELRASARLGVTEGTLWG